MSRLIITNGKSGVECIRGAGIDGDVISWDDVLHDGPVPGGYDLDVLSELRARYISSVGWGVFEDVHFAFKQRDEAFSTIADTEELVLFFEHDLYDQLQLIQILDLISNQVVTPSLLTIARPTTYIGYSTPESLREAFKSRRELSETDLFAAKAAWQAFTSETPELLEEAMDREVAGLPDLTDALRRLAEEYPHHETELSRTEAAILDCLDEEPLRAGPLFRKVQEKEEAIFMGDWSFMLRLTQLAAGAQPLVFVIDGQVEPDLTSESGYADLMTSTFGITEAGRSVLRKKARKSSYLEIDQWIGGTHITVASLWRWDPETSTFYR